MTQFRGTYSVMITPFDDAGEIDLGRLKAFTDWQVREGIHGLIPLGSTGEFLSLSDDEARKVAACVVDTVAGRVPVLVGALSSTATLCADLADPFRGQFRVTPSSEQIILVRSLIDQSLCGPDAEQRPSAAVDAAAARLRSG